MVRLTLTTLFAAVALAQLQPDPAGQKNIGNGRGIQFIGGGCLSSLDCQSQCCAINPGFGGICSGPGAQFQQGKQGCGFVGQFPGQPGFPQQPGRPVPGQPVPGQPFPGQPVPGQPFPGQPFPGQPIPGQPFPGQPGFPQQPFPGQPFPGQPFPGQPIPGQPFPGQPGFPGQFPGQQPPIIIVYPCYDRRCRKRRKQPDVIIPGLPYRLLSPGVVDQESPGAENVGTGNGLQADLGQCFADNDCQSGCCTRPDGACAPRELAEVEGGVGCGFTVDSALSVEQRVLESNVEADQVEALEAAEAAQVAEQGAQQPPARRSNLRQRRYKLQV